MIQEFLTTGLGAALLLKERVDKEMNKLQEHGKLGKEDAQALLEKLKTRGQEEEDKLKQHIKEALKEAINELGLATKADIEALKEDK